MSRVLLVTLILVASFIYFICKMGTEIKNIAVSLNASSGNNVIPIWQSILSNNRLPYGYVLELNAYVSISSIAAFTPPDLSNLNTYTLQDVIDQQYYLSSLNNPGKILNILLGDNQGNTQVPIASVVCYNRQPYVVINLSKLILNKANNLIICPGNGLYAQISQWNNNGLLSGTDQIIVYGMISELDIPV